MTAAAPFDVDYHVRSRFSCDAHSTVADNVRAARERGLRTVCLAEHVRRDSAHVPGFTAPVAALPPVPGLRVLTGAEAKILGTSGRPDVPAALPGRCPSARSLRAFADAGVPIVAGTDSHHCAGVGVCRRVRQLLGGLAAAPAPG